MDAWVRHKVGLELRQVDVQSAVETQRRRDGTYNLHTAHANRFIEGSTKVVTRQRGGRGSNQRPPVSYTHLTLPTNREV